MYVPEHFEVTDKDEIFAFIAANSFGQLISNVAGRPFSSHIPFMLAHDKTKMLGHLAQQNPQHLELDGQQALITLQGPHDYISPSWYASAGVPTWNYQALHIYGHCRVFHQTEELNALVAALTEQYESSLQNPWQPQYSAAMLNGIVGIEVTIDEVQCKYKLSQNRSAQDRSQVIQQLKALGSDTLADTMAQQAS